MATGGKGRQRRVIDLPESEEEARDDGEVDVWSETRAELDRLATYARQGRTDARGLQIVLGGVKAELLRLGKAGEDTVKRIEGHLADARERAQRMEMLWTRAESGLSHLNESMTRAAKAARR